MHHDRGTKCTPTIFSEGKNPQTHSCLRACLRVFMLTRLLLRPSGFLLAFFWLSSGGTRSRLKLGGN